MNDSNRKIKDFLGFVDSSCRFYSTALGKRENVLNCVQYQSFQKYLLAKSVHNYAATTVKCHKLLAYQN